jgi:uncharacterized damage-inducible protein DinB
MTQNNPDIDPRTIELLWNYMTYADEQEIAAVATVPDEPYFRDQGISFGSIHKLLVHSCDAQRVWCERLEGNATPMFSDPSQITRNALPDLWRESHKRLLAFASQQTADSLKHIHRFRTRKGDPYEMSRGAVMLHVCDHASYHRGQLNSMIKIAGGTPSPVMLYTWALQQGFGRQGWVDQS